MFDASFSLVFIYKHLCRRHARSLLFVSDLDFVCADRAFFEHEQFGCFSFLYFFFFLSVCSFFSKINKKEENKLETIDSNLSVFILFFLLCQLCNQSSRLATGEYQCQWLELEKQNWSLVVFDSLDQTSISSFYLCVFSVDVSILHLTWWFLFVLLFSQPVCLTIFSSSHSLPHFFLFSNWIICK